MGDLVEAIAGSGAYDLVIYDTPPALGLADSALVAEHLDGLIMLVSLSRVDRALPKEAIKRIRQAGAPVLGVVTNAREARTSGGTGDAYGYGYGYGYADYADDPAVAYAYYNQEGDGAATGDAAAGGKDRAAGGSAPGWQRLLRRANRWLDGR
jgi:Mrp family chromosome partitioning ATPase